MRPASQRLPFPARHPRLPTASWRSRWQRLSPLARDIVVVLVIKAFVLGVLWFAFFRAPVARQMTMELQRVERQLAGPRADPEPQHAVR